MKARQKRETCHPVRKARTTQSAIPPFTAIFVATLMFSATAASAAVLEATSLQFDTSEQIGHIVSSNAGSNPFNGVNINTFLGADAFYNAGFTGGNAIVANIEAGHVWNDHETLGHVTQQFNGTDGTQIGEFDRHATWVGQAIGGRNGGSAQGDWQPGIAHGATMWSGAIASSWNNPGNGNFSLSFGTTPDNLEAAYFGAMVDGAGGQTADVTNGSFGNANDNTGNGFLSGFADAIANDTGKTMVWSAGNSGSGPDNVGGPGSGFNGITVGALGSDTSTPLYDSVSDFSSRSPTTFFLPANAEGTSGTSISNARAAVDIAAPGQNLTLAFYGGESGGNVFGGNVTNDTDLYSQNVAGTSFSAPIVAGGATLVVDAVRGGLDGSAETEGVDGRVVKAILLNSADKIAGWNNSQSNVGGVVTTTQSLDYASGAGRMNLTSAYAQVTEGTASVTGVGGGTVEEIGWDRGQVSQGTPTDYIINPLLQGGSTFTTTLTWFADRTYDPTADETLYDSYDNLDLQVWEVVNGVFVNLVAESISLYNPVEHLQFDLPSTAQYGLRVLWTDELFDFGALDANTETFGLAWSGVIAIPEPASAILLLAMGLLTRRRHG